MKCFLFLLAIGFTASEKLDRTYLPPPGAQFAGGNPGDIQAPFELPNLPQTGTIQIGPNLNGIQDFGVTGQTTQVPVTTTSYAFTQTTTYPPTEGYETTILPINPVTGLPVPNLGQPIFDQYGQKLPVYTQNSDQVGPSYNVNVQPGYIPLGSVPIDQQINTGGQSYNQANPPLNQYPNQQNIPGGIQVQDITPQLPVFNINEGTQYPYPGDQSNSQIYDQYQNQNGPATNNPTPGTVSQLYGTNEGSIKYPNGQVISGQQGSTVPSTTATSQIVSNNLPGGQHLEIAHKGPLIEEFPQGIYSGKPIIIQDDTKPQFNQGNQNQGQVEPTGTFTLQPTGQQNILRPGSTLPKDTYQPGQDYNRISSTTPTPGSVSFTPAYTSGGRIIRPERPQATADRNAVILNYENVRSPNAYSYSYDTSNGIHADENGAVVDGTRAQGSYSYIGDDGKVYSVTYTADENGFQPRGDHIPTPPPIPEAIQKVIEQAARDKAAGIIDDGSYDEAKYGYKNYQRPVYHHRRPQTHVGSTVNKDRLGAQNNRVRPIVGLNVGEYDTNLPQGQLNEGSSKNKASDENPSQRDFNRITGEIFNPAINYNDQRTLNGQDPLTQPNAGQGNVLEAELNNKNQYNKFQSQDHSASGQQPITTGTAKGTETLYPGSRIEDTDSLPIKGFKQEPGLIDDNSQDSEKSGLDYRPGETSATYNINSPMTLTETQNTKQRPNISRRPDTNNGYKEKQTQDKETSHQGNLDDFVGDRTNVYAQRPEYDPNSSNMYSAGKVNQHMSKNGYYYIPPQKQYEQTQLPTRFKNQQSVKTAKPDGTIGKGTTLRPFQTPDVYRQPPRNKQDRNQNKDQPSTTRQPFMTSRVTTPGYNSYTDYDDGEDYGSDQNNENAGINPITMPDNNVNTSNRGPIEPVYTTERPQNVPYGQKIRVTQKGTVAPSQNEEYYNNVTPGSPYESITQGPTQGSRFSTTKTPSNSETQRQRRPSTSRRPGITAVGQPVVTSTPGTKITDSRYQTARPTLGYPSTTIAPGYLSEARPSNMDYQSPYGQTVSSPNYPAYTTTAPTGVPTNTIYQPGTGSYVTGLNQLSPIGTYQPGHQFTSQTPVTGTYPTSTPGYYQTTYQQAPIISTTSTVGPSTASTPGTFIISGPGTTPKSSGTYETGYHYDPPTQNYVTTHGSSAPGDRSTLPTDTGSSGSYYPQPTHSGSYQYGPAGPVYSTTTSPSTVGTTSSPFISSTTPGQQYTSTQRPIYPSAEGVYGQSPLVDGFGRPIISVQQPGYTGGGQELNQYPGVQIGGNNVSGGPIPSPNGFPTGDISTANLKPMYGEQTFNYPGYYGQPQVIGEDFRGPKQPQRFDPQTGYHY